VFFGEISLTGAVRPVGQAGPRLKEASKLGFSRAVLPQGSAKEASKDSPLSLDTIEGLTSLVAQIAASAPKKRASPGQDHPDET